MAARRWALFETDSGTEPYIINGPDRRRNPPVIIANSPKKAKRKKGTASMPVIKMRRNRKGQFVASHRSTSKKKKRSTTARRTYATNAPKRKTSRKRTRARKNYTGAGMVLPMMNPRRRKRNPAGIALPIPGLRGIDISIGDVFGIAGGIAGPPIAEGIGRKMLPTIALQYPMVIKAGSYVAPIAVGYILGGKRGARNVIVGEVAGLVVKGVTMLASKYLGSTATVVNGYINRQVPRSQLNGKLDGYTKPVSNRQLAQFPARTQRFASRFRRAL